MLITLRNLTDAELVAAIASLVGRARAATASLIAHLAELESRDLHRAQGYRSLYAYCRGVLHLSEHESYHRMEAARAARRFPVLLPMLAEGRLHLTAVCLLAPRLADENHLALLGGAIHKSKAEVEVLLARWFPRPDVKTSIRRVHGRGSRAGEAFVRAAGSEGAPASETMPVVAPLSRADTEAAPAGDASDDPHGGGLELTSPEPAPAPAPSRRTRGTIEPLSEDSYDVRFRARSQTVSRLRHAQELLSHAVPDGDVDEIVFRALGELIAQAEKRRHAARIGAPGPGGRRLRGGAPASRAIPADVEREVWARDEGQCAFVAKSGHRCEERRFLEFHHVKPWAASGPPTIANISLRCRAHNEYEARVYFGPIREAMRSRAEMDERAAKGVGASECGRAIGSRSAVERPAITRSGPSSGARSTVTG